MDNATETIRLLKHIRLLCAVIAAVALFWSAVLLYPTIRGLLAAYDTSFGRLVFAGMVIFAVALLTLVGIHSTHATGSPIGASRQSRDVSA